MTIRPEEGSRFGRYQILRRLGAGAMGEVYLAEDPQIGRRLAIKTVRLEEGRPQEVEERKKRLLREARAAGKLLHPNIVTLFDAGEDRGALFLAFEWVDGTDVDRRVADGPPLTLAEALAIVRQTAEGLDYAHRQGVVHRDIKPSNVMITADGRVKVADFGIAKVLDSTSDLTMSGSVVGSPHYLSPEQIRGEELDGRTDIFSLGVLLYEILCHRRPFDGDTLTTLVYQILNQEPTPIEVRRPELGPRLERLVRRMLHKDREQRFATAGEVAAEIAACERELAPDLLAARAVPDEPSQATTLLREEPSTAMRDTAMRETAMRGTAPRLPPPSAPRPATAAASQQVVVAAPRARPGQGRILVFAIAATLVAAVLVALGWSARRWSAQSEPKVAAATESAGPGTETKQIAAAPARPAEPQPELNTVRDEETAEPEPAASTEIGTETPGRELPFLPGERPVVRRPAPAAAPRRDLLPPPPARQREVEPPAAANPEPASPPPAADTAAAAEPAAPALAPPVDSRAAREELIARMPVAREMTTSMSLSFELPKPVAERMIVRLDRIVLGRAADWNASKRGGRAYSVPEPGLHILTFLLDGAEVYRIRIDAQPGRPGPTTIAPEVGPGARRRGAG